MYNACTLTRHIALYSYKMAETYQSITVNIPSGSPHLDILPGLSAHFCFLSKPEIRDMARALLSSF